MAVWYLDNDDEITDAVARLRGVTDEQVVFVVPPGSRIATGRINFKLLAKEAGSRNVRMAIASPDQQVRAMATSAGVLSATTADQASAALERGDVAPPPGDPAVVEAGAPAPEYSSTADGEVEVAGTGLFLGWSAQRLAATVVIVLLLVVGAGYVALQTLPTAEITLTPRTVAVGPLEVPVMALPEVSEPDFEAGLVPAVAVPIPLTIQRTFPATGVERVASPATGEVVFSSAETFQAIAAGTRVMTPSEIEFQTTERVTLAAPGPGESEGSVSAPVIAVDAGADGNVDAGEISVVPSLEDQGISVTNPTPTTGGRQEESPRVTAADYNGAVADIENRFPGVLEAWLGDPANAPAGLVLYPDTAVAGLITYAPDLDDVAGSRRAQFTLVGSMEATVLGVDENPIAELLRKRLASGSPDGMVMLDSEATVEVGDGAADGQRIRYSGRADGRAYQPVDIDAVATRIAGLPISEARAILEALGTTTVNVWPEFLADLPGDSGRITLEVRDPSTTE